MAVAPDVVLDERARPGEGGWLVTERRLRQTAALCHQGDVDPGVAAIVAACDGQRTLGDVLAEVAASADVSAADMGAAAIPIIRRLIEQAFLLPVSPRLSVLGASCYGERNDWHPEGDRAQAGQSFLLVLRSQPALIGVPALPDDDCGV